MIQTIILGLALAGGLMYYPPEPVSPPEPWRPDVSEIVQYHRMDWTQQAQPVEVEDEAQECPAHLAADSMCDQYFMYVVNAEQTVQLLYQQWLTEQPADLAAQLPQSLGE